MNRKTSLISVTCAFLLALTTGLPVDAQSAREREKAATQSQLTAAEAAIAAARAVDAATLAAELYEEAVRRAGVARQDWNSNNADMRRIAGLRAVEAEAAAAAAEALAQLILANRDIRTLSTDISTLGGTVPSIQLYDPPMLNRRAGTPLDRVIIAENALAAARAAGGASVAPGDLDRATEILKTARMLARRNTQAEVSDHLAFMAEMMSRRAEYLARRNTLTPRLPELRAERTRLAQAAADTRAREEQARRVEAERVAAELRQRLQAETQSRQLEQAELDRLRQQVATSEAEFRQRLQTDREARIAAELALDEIVARYQSALAERGASNAEVDQLRRQVEDQSMTLRTLQERERLSESSMETQIKSLESALERERSEGRLTQDVLAQRERELRTQREELSRLQAEREESNRRRVEAETARQAAIADAERRRTEAEAQAETLRQQIAAERSRAAETEAELARAREELSRRDAANAERVTRMQEELAKLAETRTTERGFIVTLPGLFFDSGKSVLKPGARNTLTKIAEQLRINDQLSITIEGHTDSVGSDAMNQALSEKRAEAVRSYLQNRGIPANRMTVTGLGETSPIATNDTPAGRQQNRRVELVISQ